MGPISRQELIKAVQKLKNNKAPGRNSIPPGALKADPETTVDILQDLIANIWELE
ncbi:hypothetical protein DPMN_161894 [Dreissena polymorpha]|uniref:Uncharacterized protein n=1 Tax=Dreissena polymorpha TaxID=45954 RepID=A0A9D4EQQ4_DREPO|nr:hypothetical protein DPMN_161894 [Dreissena polymorpha]